MLVLLLCYVSRSSLYCNIPSDLCTLVFVLLSLLHCFIFMLVLLLCYVSRSSLYCNIPSDLCSLCLSCYYFYIVLSLYLYCCYVVYLDHHITIIYFFRLLLCVYRSSLYCNILSDLCLVITSTLFYLYACTVVMLCIRSSLYCNIPSDLCSSVCLVITSTLFYLYACTVVMLCIRSSLYCNIPSDLCSLCLSCYYFYIVLYLCLYCCYVVYLDHHFTVIYLQTCVLCVCLVITSTLYYLYTCTVVMLCIQIITLL